jgi:hypothetical protein
MPQGWGEQAERKLLLSILDPDVKPKWDVVAARMGEGFTGEACRYVPLFGLEPGTLTHTFFLLGRC